jgi:chromosome segregation ATPase
MAYDINLALERLEKNLSSVNTAREQVDKTISTSQDLQRIISEYSRTIHSINQEIGNFVDEVRNYENGKEVQLLAAVSGVEKSCDKVITNFNNETEVSVKAFKKDLSEVLSQFNSENAKFSEEVQQLDALRTALNNATNEINEIENKLSNFFKTLEVSQKEQDKMLDDIVLVGQDQSRQLGLLSQDIKSSQDTQDADLKEIRQKVITLSQTQPDFENKVSHQLSDIETRLALNETTNAILAKNLSVTKIIGIISLIMIILCTVAIFIK